MYLHYQLSMPFSSENQTSYKATSISCISSLLIECLVKTNFLMVLFQKPVNFIKCKYFASCCISVQQLPRIEQKYSN